MKDMVLIFIKLGTGDKNDIKKRCNSNKIY